MFDSGSRVAAEFLGQARALRRRLRDADRVWSTTVTRISEKAVARCARSPIPRPELLIGLARDWRDKTPPFGRLDMIVEAAKRSLRIQEIRTGACDVRSPEWDAEATEPGVTVFKTVLRLAPHEHEFSLCLLACVSLHALGRRYQRGMDVSEAAVLADLHALARAHAALTETAANVFEVPAGGGRWAGRCVKDSDQAERTLIARTYLSAER